MWRSTYLNWTKVQGGHPSRTVLSLNYKVQRCGGEKTLSCKIRVNLRSNSILVWTRRRVLFRMQFHAIMEPSASNDGIYYATAWNIIPYRLYPYFEKFETVFKFGRLRLHTHRRRLPRISGGMVVRLGHIRTLIVCFLIWFLSFTHLRTRTMKQIYMEYTATSICRQGKPKVIAAKSAFPKSWIVGWIVQYR